MKLRNIGIVSSLCVAVVAASLFAGCSKDSNNSGTPPRLSRKGESCLSTGDCSEGLSCVPAPGGDVSVCVTGEFKIAATAKECALVLCSQATDCCPEPPSNCARLKADCEQFGDAGFNSSCRNYEQLCVCDSNKYACDKGACRSICTDDIDCGGSLKCNNDGKCVQCSTDNDCPGEETCLKGACVPPCTSDAECPSFNRCSSGKCVESGCKSDRECVAATRNVEAKCADGKCQVPCQTDLECGNPKSYTFYSCINNQCTYTGCESDKECALYYGQASGSSLGFDGGITGASTRTSRAVCRDKTASSGR